MSLSHHFQVPKLTKTDLIYTQFKDWNYMEFFMKNISEMGQLNYVWRTSILQLVLEKCNAKFWLKCFSQKEERPSWNSNSDSIRAKLFFINKVLLFIYMQKYLLLFPFFTPNCFLSFKNDVVARSTRYFSQIFTLIWEIVIVYLYL